MRERCDHSVSHSRWLLGTRPFWLEPLSSTFPIQTWQTRSAKSSVQRLNLVEVQATVRSAAPPVRHLLRICYYAAAAFLACTLRGNFYSVVPVLSALYISIAMTALHATSPIARLNLRFPNMFFTLRLYTAM